MQQQKKERGERGEGGGVPGHRWIVRLLSRGLHMFVCLLSSVFSLQAPAAASASVAVVVVFCCPVTVRICAEICSASNVQRAAAVPILPHVAMLQVWNNI